ncbi:MAG: DNA gyrase inhibitor YacG [Burkholderiaceae bacterium]
MGNADTSNQTPAVARTVRCPSCGGPSLFGSANRFRPFCSERCRQVDLGAWASEAFRVPAPPDQDFDAVNP